LYLSSLVRKVCNFVQDCKLWQKICFKSQKKKYKNNIAFLVQIYNKNNTRIKKLAKYLKKNMNFVPNRRKIVHKDPKSIKNNYFSKRHSGKRQLKEAEEENQKERKRKKH